MSFEGKAFHVNSTKWLEMLSAEVLYVLLVGLIFIGIWICTYILLYSAHWYIAVIYLIWIWIIDKDTPEGVSRTSNWVRSWRIFEYAASYFPVNVHPEPGFLLEANRNYLACCYPHGVMPTGVILAFLTNACGTKSIMPYHTTYGITLKGLFNVPIYRDFILSLGMCSANAKSIERLLSNPGGGKVAGLIAGGSGEMFDSHSGQYKIVLKQRKGFIKLALKSGSPIVPVFSFGENSIYKQKVFPKGSLIRSFQEWFKTKAGFPIVLFYGRGLFQDKFGLTPLSNPINVVVGKPMDIQKNENPTQADIDTTHEKFVEKLKALFQEYKYRYEANPDKSSLLIC